MPKNHKTCTGAIRHQTGNSCHSVEIRISIKGFFLRDTGARSNTISPTLRRPRGVSIINDVLKKASYGSTSFTTIEAEDIYISYLEPCLLYIFQTELQRKIQNKSWTKPTVMCFCPTMTVEPLLLTENSVRVRWQMLHLISPGGRVEGLLSQSCPSVKRM